MLATPYIHDSFVPVVSEVPVREKDLLTARSELGFRLRLQADFDLGSFIPDFLCRKAFLSQNGNTPPWGSHQMISGKVHNSEGNSLLKPLCDLSSAALRATTCSNITSIVKNELAQPLLKTQADSWNCQLAEPGISGQSDSSFPSCLPSSPLLFRGFLLWSGLALNPSSSKISLLGPHTPFLFLLPHFHLYTLGTNISACSLLRSSSLLLEAVCLLRSRGCPVHPPPLLPFRIPLSFPFQVAFSLESEQEWPGVYSLGPFLQSVLAQAIRRV